MNVSASLDEITLLAGKSAKVRTSVAGETGVRPFYSEDGGWWWRLLGLDLEGEPAKTMSG